MFSTSLRNRLSEVSWALALAASFVYAALRFLPEGDREDWMVKACLAAGLAWLFFILCFSFLQRSLTPQMLWVKSTPVMFVLWLVGRQVNLPYPAIPLVVTASLSFSKDITLVARLSDLAVLHIQHGGTESGTAPRSWDSPV